MPVAVRRTSDQSIGFSLSAVLLPTDGARVPVQPPAPGGTLAAEALRLRRRLADPAALPPAWSERAFVREVGLVRAHLAPIRSRAGLAASFSREAFHVVPADEVGEATGAVRVAYALRWLELGSGRAWPSWPPFGARGITTRRLTRDGRDRCPAAILRAMRLSQLFFTTLRDDPSDAEMPSHRLLAPGGLRPPARLRDLLAAAARQAGQRSRRAGHPRGDQTAIGGQEMEMPVVHPAEVWKESGRYARSGPSWSGSRTAANGTWSWR